MALPTLSDMVYNRLPFLDKESEVVAQLVQDFIYEAAYELENCFQIRYVVVDGERVEDWSRVGDEQYYRLDQKSIIADLVAIYILMAIILQNSQGNPNEPNPVIPVTKFLKRAKAGSAEVEWDQLSYKDSNILSIPAEKMLDRLKASAERKLRNFGCILDICTDCVSIANDFQTSPMPFITVSGCGCC